MHPAEIATADEILFGASTSSLSSFERFEIQAADDSVRFAQECLRRFDGRLRKEATSRAKAKARELLRHPDAELEVSFLSNEPYRPTGDGLHVSYVVSAQFASVPYVEATSVHFSIAELLEIVEDECDRRSTS